MNKRSYYFIKLNISYLSNAKFIKLKNDTKWIYIGLYLLAQECDMGGLLFQYDQPLTIEDLSLLLHTSDISKNLDELIKAGFIVYENGGYGIHPDIFISEQGVSGFGEKAEKQRSEWVNRQRKHRSKQNANIREDDDDDKPY